MTATTLTRDNHQIEVFDTARQRVLIDKAIRRQSFCTLATSSAAQRPHVAGVIYAPVGEALYINTFENSIKARNIRENPLVAVCIPVRTLPIGPPYTVQFQGEAAVFSRDDPHILELARTDQLKRITSHGELEQPGTCFVRIEPGGRIASFGLGVSLRSVSRNPFGAIRSVER